MKAQQNSNDKDEDKDGSIMVLDVAILKVWGDEARTTESGCL